MCNEPVSEKVIDVIELRGKGSAYLDGKNAHPTTLSSGWTRLSVSYPLLHAELGV